MQIGGSIPTSAVTYTAPEQSPATNEIQSESSSDFASYSPNSAATFSLMAAQLINPLQLSASASPISVEAIGPETQLNTSTNDFQNVSEVLYLPNNKLVAIWQSAHTGAYHVFGRLLNDTGQPESAEFQIDAQDSFAWWSSSASLMQGGFVTTYSSDNRSNLDPSGYGIYGRILDDAGEPITNDFLVNTTTINPQQNSSVAPLDSGGFVVVWESLQESNEGVYWAGFGQIFDSTGNKIGQEFSISDFSAQNLSVFRLDNQGFGVTFASSDGIFTQKFSESGTATGDPIAHRESGLFTFSERVSDQIGNQGFATSIFTGGNVVVEEFTPSGTSKRSFVINENDGSSHFWPSISNLDDDHYLITWVSDDEDGLGTYGKIVNRLSGTSSEVFQINTETTGTQQRPSATSMGSGEFYVSWESYNQDGSGYGVFGQKFSFLSNDPPVATDDSATVDEDSIDNSIDVLANDSDSEDDSLTVTITEGPSHGSATIGDSGEILYTPEADFSGEDSVGYTISDGFSTDSANVTINITAINDAPIATADNFTVAENSQPTSLNVIENDLDVDTSDNLEIVAITTPDNSGSASISNGEIEYQPAADFFGEETFDYTISDGTASATATVSITVTEVADDPPSGSDAAIATANSIAVKSSGEFSSLNESFNLSGINLLTAEGREEALILLEIGLPHILSQASKLTGLRNRVESELSPSDNDQRSESSQTNEISAATLVRNNLEGLVTSLRPDAASEIENLRSLTALLLR